MPVSELSSNFHRISSIFYSILRSSPIPDDITDDVNADRLHRIYARNDDFTNNAVLTSNGLGHSPTSWNACRRKQEPPVETYAVRESRPLYHMRNGFDREWV
jgi:hypothetical protein